MNPIWWMVIYGAGVVVAMGIVLWDTYRPMGWEETAVCSHRKNDLGTVLLLILFWPLCLLTPPLLLIYITAKFAIWGLTQPLATLFKTSDPFWIPPTEDVGEFWSTLRYFARYQSESVKLVFKRAREHSHR
jgi:hypothetical protein